MAPTFTPFETKEKMSNSETVPLASGIIVDFAEFQEYDTEGKQNAVLTALSRLKLTQRPCMIMELAPVADLGLQVDGKDYEPGPTGTQDENDVEKKLAPIARIVLPVDSIVDLTQLRPSAGSSVVRANGAVPSYRWFQGANLLLQDKKEFGRIIPFPLEQDNGDITYQVLRVSPEEFKQYQQLLEHATKLDGIEQGFYIAAKYAYQCLLNRGHSELTYKAVGKFVTDIAIMRDSRMHGALILNSGGDDFEGIERLSLFF
jgi:hypothetical protein